MYVKCNIGKLLSGYNQLKCSLCKRENKIMFRRLKQQYIKNILLTSNRRSNHKHNTSHHKTVFIVSPLSTKQLDFISCRFDKLAVNLRVPATRARSCVVRLRYVRSNARHWARAADITLCGEDNSKGCRFYLQKAASSNIFLMTSYHQCLLVHFSASTFRVIAHWYFVH